MFILSNEFQEKDTWILIFKNEYEITFIIQTQYNNLSWHINTVCSHSICEGRLQQLSLVSQSSPSSAPLSPDQLTDGQTQVHSIPHHEPDTDMLLKWKVSYFFKCFLLLLLDNDKQDQHMALIKALRLFNCIRDIKLGLKARIALTEKLVDYS